MHVSFLYIVMVSMLGIWLLPAIPAYISMLLYAWVCDPKHKLYKRDYFHFLVLSLLPVLNAFAGLVFFLFTAAHIAAEVSKRLKRLYQWYHTPDDYQFQKYHEPK